LRCTSLNFQMHYIEFYVSELAAQVSNPGALGFALGLGLSGLEAVV
jgi:hypothetical protein